MPLVLAAAAFGLLSTIVDFRLADAVAVPLVAATFLGVGIFQAQLGLEELYAFVGLALFTTQLTRFRAMARPLAHATLDATSRQALRSLYVTFLQRLGFLIILVVLISLTLFFVASLVSLSLSTEETAFFLSVAILLALLAIARPRSQARG